MHALMIIVFANFEDYYSKWIGNDTFRSTVQELMIDEELKKDPEKAVKILQEFLKYVLDCLKTFEEHKNKMPAELQGFFGSILLRMAEPEKSREREDKFFKYIIPFQQNAEKFLETAAKAHNELVSKKLENPEKWADSDATVTGDDWRSKDDLSYNKNKQK